MESAKYLVIAGWVRSRNDGDRHWISGKQLCSLYGVNPKDCRFYSEDEVGTYAFPEERVPGAVILRPDPTGKYELPKPARSAEPS